MKTFFESLLITKNTKLLQNLVLELEDLGIDSSKFIDWYIENGIELQKDNLLIEGFNGWVLREGILDNLFSRWKSGKDSGQSNKNEFPTIQRFGKTLGNYTQRGGELLGSQIGKARDAYQSFSKGLEGTSSKRTSLTSSARAALSELSKRINTSKELQSAINDPNFVGNLTNLTMMLNNLKENSIENKLLLLSCRGLDVEDLVEYFSLEINKVNEGIGTWLQKAGNWLGGQWSNLRNAWSNWNSGAEIQRNKQAVENAIKALSDLKNKRGADVSPEFLELLDSVFSKLTLAQNKLSPDSPSSGEAPPPAESNPNPNPNPNPEPVPAPAPATDTPGISVSSSDSMSKSEPDESSFKNGVSFVGSKDQQSGSYQSGWMGDTSAGQEDYIGKMQMYKGKQPRPGVKKPINPGTGTIGVGAGIDPNARFESQEHIVDINPDDKKFLDSIMPKENKFSWYGY